MFVERRRFSSRVKRHVRAIVASALGVACLVGCGGGGYQLHGRIVEGAYATMEFVDPASLPPGAAVQGATVALFRDPGRPSERLVARTLSSKDGSFTLDVTSFGAGWMEESWRIEADGPRHVPAQVMRPLPPAKAGRALAIILTRGQGTPAWERGDGTGMDQGTSGDSEDLWAEVERYR